MLETKCVAAAASFSPFIEKLTILIKCVEFKFGLNLRLWGWDMKDCKLDNVSKFERSQERESNRSAPFSCTFETWWISITSALKFKLWSVHKKVLLSYESWPLGLWPSRLWKDTWTSAFQIYMNALKLIPPLPLNTQISLRVWNSLWTT